MINNRIWYAGTAFVSVAVILLGWFIGVAPELAEAKAADTELAAVQVQNQLKQTELTRLRDQFENVSDTETELASVRESLPGDVAMTGFLKEIEGDLAAHTVTLDSLSVGDAQPYVEAIAVDSAPAEAPAEADPAEADPASGEDAETAAAPAPAVGTIAPVAGTVVSDPSVTGENFVLIPISLGVSGSAENVSAFIGALQEAKRLFLVTDITMEADERADGMPGGVSAALSGYLYVLLDADSASGSVETVDPPVDAPAEASGTRDQ